MVFFVLTMTMTWDVHNHEDDTDDTSEDTEQRPNTHTHAPCIKRLFIYNTLFTEVIEVIVSEVWVGSYLSAYVFMSCMI